jgi:hypothetical protein
MNAARNKPPLGAPRSVECGAGGAERGAGGAERGAGGAERGAGGAERGAEAEGEGSELRCACGSLLARYVGGKVELKCRRCKRTMWLTVSAEEELDP